MYIILININLSYLNESLKKSWNQDVIISATYPMGGMINLRATSKHLKINTPIILTSICIGLTLNELFALTYYSLYIYK